MRGFRKRSKTFLENVLRAKDRLSQAGGQFSFPVSEEAPQEFSRGGVVRSGLVHTASVRWEHEVVGVDSFD